MELDTIWLSMDIAAALKSVQFQDLDQFELHNMNSSIKKWVGFSYRRCIRIQDLDHVSDPDQGMDWSQRRCLLCHENVKTIMVFMHYAILNLHNIRNRFYYHPQIIQKYRI